MDANGNFVICWQGVVLDYRGDLNPAAIVQRYDFNGNKLGSNFKAKAQWFSVAPDIGCNESGDFALCWVATMHKDHRLIAARRYSRSGVLLDLNFGYRDFDPDFGWQYLVSGTDGNCDIHARCYNRSGVPQGKIFRVNDDTGDASQINPAIEADAKGNFVICWQENRNGDGDIYAQKYIRNGREAYGKNYRVNDGRQHVDQTSPDVSLKNGKIYYTWQDYRNTGKGADIFARIEEFTSANKLYWASRIPSRQEIPEIDGIIDEAIWNVTPEGAILFGGIPDA